MVENLNKLTFSGYGRVLRDSLPNRGFPSGAQWQESVQYFSAEGLCFYRQSAGPVYLDFELGMTVLAVRREGAFPIRRGAAPSLRVPPSRVIARRAQARRGNLK